MQLYVLPYECPGLCRHRPGQNIKLHEMKNEKKLYGFSYTQNIANFEAFRWNISLSANLLFLKSGTHDGCEELTHQMFQKSTQISL